MKAIMILLSFLKKNIPTMLIFLFSYQITIAQKASDVLENGISIQKGHRLFLKYNISKKVLESDAIEDGQGVDFTTLEDSIIFLVRKNEINIYLRPLNPLNYSYNAETKVVIDPINEAAAKAIGEIIGVLEKVAPKFTPAAGDPKIAPEKCKKLEELKDSIKSIQAKLNVSQKDKIINIFDKLKALTFDNEQSTIKSLDDIKKEINMILTHFDDITKLIEKVKGISEGYKCSCPYPDEFTAKYIFNAILKDLSAALEEQKKRFTNLQAAYNLVEGMQVKASANEVNKLKWYILLDDKGVKVTEGKISICTVTIKESGYKKSSDNEIVSSESKEIMKRTLRFRKFQRFVPEVSVGTAFTFLEYNSYGTVSDSTGQQFVSSPTKNTLRNLNITTMLNFNYYIPDSAIHPFYQLGLGVNSGIPTILTGLGFRSNISGLRRVAIAGGIAMTWVKELDKLKVGDKITGTDDIDKDYKYSSSPKFSPYVGLQFNF
jgi:hypothetical protein